MQKPHPREACILFGETINTSIHYSILEGITSKKSNKEQMILSVRARDFMLGSQGRAHSRVEKWEREGCEDV